MKKFTSINPFDQTVIAEYAVFDDNKIDSVLSASEKAFSDWKNTSIDFRADLLNKAAKVLRENREKYAMTISLEMGKILNESRAEVEKCAWNCTYYATHAENMIEKEVIKSDAYKSYVVFEPIGCVFAIMPWNFPFWQVFRFAAPALMAGNTIILKHARNVCGCSLAIESVFREAGFPDHVFQSVIVDSNATEKIISHDIIQGVTLTGSEIAGSSVASIAGKHIKKTVLELGGTDPLIVLKDANIKNAAKIALQSRFQNAGQSCIASKRFIVESECKVDFINALLEGVNKLKQGNQLLEETTTGPMAKIEQAEQLEEQELQSVKQGAIIAMGGKRSGANYHPTILENIQPGMQAFDEELFGPIASIIEARDEMHAVALANNSRYGLGATLFTEDLEKAQVLARKINAGGVFINAMVKSDPRLPFGGIKKSGYGRELSHYGMKEFMNIKTVYLNE